MGGLGEGAMWEDLPLEEFVMGEEKFHEGAQDFLTIFLKNNEKINMKFFLSTESKDQH